MLSIAHAVWTAMCNVALCVCIIIGRTCECVCTDICVSLSVFVLELVCLYVCERVSAMSEMRALLTVRAECLL